MVSYEPKHDKHTDDIMDHNSCHEQVPPASTLPRSLNSINTIELPYKSIETGEYERGGLSAIPGNAG